jgi:hypothetical protein
VLFLSTLSFRCGYLLVDVYLECVGYFGTLLFRELLFMHLRVSGGTAERVGFQVSVYVWANHLDVGGTTVWMAGVGFGVMVSFCFLLLLANLGTWRNLYGIRWGGDKGMRAGKSETIRIRKYRDMNQCPAICILPPFSVSMRLQCELSHVAGVQGCGLSCSMFLKEWRLR